LPQKFDQIWRRFMVLCVEHLPWDSMVDFQAHVWPRSHEGKAPDVPFSAKFAELSGDAYTAMRVMLHGREVELKYYPAGEFWRSCGRVHNGLDKTMVVEFSPKNGVLTRGSDKLEGLAMQAIDWLNNSHESTPKPVRQKTDVVK
jgi:hypothetical protein